MRKGGRLLEEIHDLYQAYLKLQFGLTPVRIEGLDFNSVKELEDYATKLVESIWIRDNWYKPGEIASSGEYEIVLKCSALHLAGTLKDGLPTSVRAKMCDPTVPRGMCPLTNYNETALLWFAKLFFKECVVSGCR